MRKPFSLLLAAALIGGVVAWWWPPRDFAVSIVPGWHTVIFSPSALGNIFVSAALLLVGVVMVARALDRSKASE